MGLLPPPAPPLADRIAVAVALPPLLAEQIIELFPYHPSSLMLAPHRSAAGFIDAKGTYTSAGFPLSQDGR